MERSSECEESTKVRLLLMEEDYPLGGPLGSGTEEILGFTFPGFLQILCGFKAAWRPMGPCGRSRASYSSVWRQTARSLTKSGQDSE